MAPWHYRFPQEKTTMCVLAAQTSMIIFNEEQSFAASSIFFGQILSTTALGKSNKNLRLELRQITNTTLTGYEWWKASCLQTSNHNQNSRTTRQMELIQSNKICCLFSDPSSIIQVENNYLLFYLVILDSSSNILGHAVTFK